MIKLAKFWTLLKNPGNNRASALILYTVVAMFSVFSVIWAVFTHTDKGSITATPVIHITLDEYEARLRQRELKVEQQLQQAHHAEQQILLQEKADIEHRLLNVEASYRSHVEELGERIRQLEKGEQIPAQYLSQAKQALSNGEWGKADGIFAQIEQQTEGSIQVAAQAAYQRSRIARDEIRYQVALTHAIRAVQLAPDDSLYLNNLGSSLARLGQFTKAMRHFKEALNINRDTLGEEHPSTATSYNNVAYNLNAQGRYKQAEPLYRKGLEISQRVLGEDHPQTQTIANNLQSVRQKIGQ